MSTNHREGRKKLPVDAMPYMNQSPYSKVEATGSFSMFFESGDAVEAAGPSSSMSRKRVIVLVFWP